MQHKLDQKSNEKQFVLSQQHENPVRLHIELTAIRNPICYLVMEKHPVRLPGLFILLLGIKLQFLKRSLLNHS